MILLAMLLVAQTAPLPNAPDDIVVTGRRIKRLRMTTRLDRASGVTRCVFKRHSGDPKFDTTVCDAVLACAPKAKTVEEMQRCVAPTMNALVAKDAPWKAESAKSDP